MQSMVKEIAQNLVNDFNKSFDDFQGLYLYGLFVDENEHPDEDIEFIAIFGSEDKEKREKIWRIIGQQEEKYDVYIELNPMTTQALESDEELFAEIIKYGIFFENQ